MFKYILIVILLLALVWLTLIVGFALGINHIHKKIDTSMYRAYENAVQSYATSSDKTINMDYIRGVEYADAAIIRTLHGWKGEIKNNETNT